jgi:acylphosphatase
MASDQIAVRVRVSGRVQGVSYRAWAQDEARQYDVAGWVRNAADGSVHALLVGSEDEIDRFVERLGEGPPAADVREVETEPADLPDPLPEDFLITR